MTKYCLGFVNSYLNTALFWFKPGLVYPAPYYTWNLKSTAFHIRKYVACINTSRRQSHKQTQHLTISGTIFSRRRSRRHWRSPSVECRSLTPFRIFNASCWKKYDSILYRKYIARAYVHTFPAWYNACIAVYIILCTDMDVCYYLTSFFAFSVVEIVFR